MKNKCSYFCNAHCFVECPNFTIDYCDQLYGVGIAEDIGFERIKCKDCYYNKRLSCLDCLFYKSLHCSDRIFADSVADRIIASGCGQTFFP